MVDAGNAPRVGLSPNGCNNDRLIRASIVSVKQCYISVIQFINVNLFFKQLPVSPVMMEYLESFDVDQMHTHVCPSGREL